MSNIEIGKWQEFKNYPQDNLSELKKSFESTFGIQIKLIPEIKTKIDSKKYKILEF